MASGTISLNKSSTTSDGYWLEGKIEWSSTANNDANTSSVIADIYVKKNITARFNRCCRYCFLEKQKTN